MNEEQMISSEDIAEVKSSGKGFAVVILRRSDACKSCTMNAFCGSGKSEIEQKVETDLELKPGDRVKIYLEPGIKLLSSFIIFVIPIIAMLLFYLIAHFAHLSEPLAISASFLGLLVSGIAIYILDKKFARKIHFEIIERVENEDSSA
ncbi:MAG: SoxR reducing system RseC family protein [Candidatus Cloacimonetes bacterium]|nr:SoxR reducing system RseC family protein [Candidatus Cloacimonadota bacterium]